MHTVIGAFEDRGTAERAVDRLVQAGIDRDDIHVEQSATTTPAAEGTTTFAGSSAEEYEDHGGPIRNFFARLFGEARDDALHAKRYSEAVRRGSSVVVVDTLNAEQADEASTLLHELGAINVDERAEGGGVRVFRRDFEKPVRELREEQTAIDRPPASREDTVRRKDDADVERLEGQGRTTERERAAAADRTSDELGSTADPEVTGGKSKTLRKPRKKT